MASRTSSPHPVGVVTRGTTHPNRLRRIDRWIAATHGPELRRSPAPVAVDLGFGAAPWTAVELLARLRAVAPHTRVVGVEIDPARVEAAQPYAREGLRFLRGGFEIPLTAPGRRPDAPGRGPDATGRQPDAPGLALIRAANVLRQYDEADVAGAWERLCGRLAPADPARGSRGGLLVEGTCDEIGRRHVWVALGPEGPRTVTFAARLGSLGRPSDLAERLPKALIHRNVPGEPVHAFLRDFDHAWASAAPFAAYGARQRWVSAVRALAGGWPVVDGAGRWRQGEVTVRWEALSPRA
ncbi:hypothetical protein GCM10018793_56110 [Streptomyces sulfonofaciens]|uniref:Class I SAM-dependent methyltransferase n=1 Tax=Streptomyces sulfonofaciens TaxID=68272 RepID=A0A919L6Q2_9ACTN|nr:class I SAM-dependent methyltransferase [Streptomyces sulfonofaciens]GHH85977.1 hypothetical protein GCM10018793_56110 [Streptomyces sulfonofaciens]